MSAPVPRTSNARIDAFLDDMVALCRPDAVAICDGSAEEYDRMARLMVDAGTARWLERRPHSLHVRSTPGDVARVEERTFICSASQQDAGPTNNWAPPAEMRATLRRCFDGSMVGRTLYAIPYSMGPIGSPIAKVGFELTDSPYVVANMHIMTRVGQRVLRHTGGSDDVVLSVHSVGHPLADQKQADLPWPSNADTKYIVHFPEAREIWSYGSGYGGNALLGKKCHALRIASVQARDEGWMAEHMLILKLTNPEGRARYVCGAFPSACGKTNLAMMNPTLPGWKVETIGDDIAWMKLGADGRLRAINPEAGFFGVAPGTSMTSNPNAMLSLESNAIFTNCAVTEDGDVWWEGMSPGREPESLVDWLRRPWHPGCGRPSSHPNARFTAPARQCPVIAPEWEDPEGVPIDAILFGGRRAGVVPLVVEAFSWRHGTFLGSIMASETTTAAAGKVGVLRRDPFAMLPFCGYHMGDYFAHWLAIGKRAGAAGPGVWAGLPRLYYVNWFRRGADGRFLWPGYGENGRVLKWIFERCDGTAEARRTPIGLLPTPESLDLEGLSLPGSHVDVLLGVDVDGWRDEISSIEEHYSRFGARLPPGLPEELEQLQGRLEAPQTEP